MGVVEVSHMVDSGFETKAYSSLHRKEMWI